MSTLLACPQGHKWWQPFSDGPGGGRPVSTCPRCGAAVECPATPPAGENVKPRTSYSPTTASMEFGTLRLELKISGQPVQMAMDVPTGQVKPRELLPIFRDVAEKIVDLGIKAVEAKGELISCKAGCGACCRQLVPISELEARQLRDLVEDLPEPRRTEVRARFAEARRRLQEAGLLDKLLHPEQFPDDELRPVGLDYFRQAIPCPFLDEESCSIHPERPISCREYLVTSPAVNCAEPTPETVHCVPLAGKVSSALYRLQIDPNARFVRWVPLSLALDWVEAHPDEPPRRPAQEMLREFFQRLAEKKKEGS
jgi:Fe-S-cluster containining protein